MRYVSRRRVAEGDVAVQMRHVALLQNPDKLPLSPVQMNSTIRCRRNMVGGLDILRFSDSYRLLDRLSVPACLNGTVTSWFDTGELFVVEL